MTIAESILSGQCRSEEAAPEGIEWRILVSNEKCGATGFSTGTTTFHGGAELPYHTHDCSEAITILEGCAQVSVEGRAYLLFALDCMHIPAGVAHCVRNEDGYKQTIAHWALGSAFPTRNLATQKYGFDNRGLSNPALGDPETINRFAESPVYELANGAFFYDLFARRFGSVGICGGYGRFLQGSSLPCHIHDYDESITIVQGEAVCLVQGNQYRLSGLDTAFVPKHKPHRFLNQSQGEMAMLWVYAGDEPDRKLVDADYCSGSLAWQADLALSLKR